MIGGRALTRLERENLGESEINDAEAKKKAYQNQLREQMEEAKRKKEEIKRKEKEEAVEEERRFQKDREVLEKRHAEELAVQKKKKQDEEEASRAAAEKLKLVQQQADEEKKKVLAEAMEQHKMNAAQNQQQQVTQNRSIRPPSAKITPAQPYVNHLAEAHSPFPGNKNQPDGQKKAYNKQEEQHNPFPGNRNNNNQQQQNAYDFNMEDSNPFNTKPKDMPPSQKNINSNPQVAIHNSNPSNNYHYNENILYL